MADSTAVKAGFCRACHAFCPIHLDIEDGKAVALKPVKEHPVYHGYACAKGRASPDFHYMEGRLLSSMKRQPNGTHRPIASSLAIREIAERLQRIIERHGPRSVALYTGTFGAINLAASVFSEGFMAAIDSPMLFNSMQIDQPGKPISQAIHGSWLAGHANLDQADAWLVIGTNPTVSMLGPPNPPHLINRAKKRGARIYVIDPRRSDMARQADIFLQILPGQDAVVLAGLINIILQENLQDHAFIAANVRGVDDLRKAVSKFTPEFVAQCCGVPVEELRALALGYAASKCGVIFAGTGPNMSPHGTLMEYLRLSLMSLCGHWRRAGDDVPAHSVLIHLPPAIAQAMDPRPGWNLGDGIRSRNLTNTACGMPTSALAEEILLEGAGQIRVLISNGGNPMLAWPDQMRTQQAMKELELLICIDPVMSETAKHAHYVIAPRIQQETMQTTALGEMMWGWFPTVHPIEAYAACSPALIEPPEGSDVIYDWSFFHELARAMGVAMKLKPTSFVFDPVEAQKRQIQLDMDRSLTVDEVWEYMLTDSPVALAEVRRYPTGNVFEMPDEKKKVLPKTEGWAGKLDVGNADMMADMQRAYEGPDESETQGFSHRLISRRLKDRYNSSWRHHKVSVRQWTYNPAFMNPTDLAKLGIADGDIVEIRSRHGAIRGVVEADATVRTGVISMSHAWGKNPDETADPLGMGANTGLLTDTTTDYDIYSAMPRMSSIPVNISLFEKRR
jgi:anaerobic selenocysteine-containing dehydrogenase